MNSDLSYGNHKLVFRDIKLSDKNIVDMAVRYSNSMSCQLSFANLYCLAPKYKTKICVQDGILYIKQKQRDEGAYAAYLLPMRIPKEKEKNYQSDESFWFQKAFRTIKEQAHSEGKNLMIFGVTEDQLEPVVNEGGFRCVENRDWADYIYLSKRMITLRGKRLAGKRNEYNGFMRQYGKNIHISKITGEKIEEIREFQKKWFENNVNKNPKKELLTYENEGIKRALDSYEDLGLKGIVMYIDGTVAAYSYGYPMTDQVFDVIVEKGDYQYPNIYRAINRQFVRHCCTGYPYINREEDIGLTGLRQVKLAYQPEIILKKYNLYESKGWG